MFYLSCAFGQSWSMSSSLLMMFIIWLAIWMLRSLSMRIYTAVLLVQWLRLVWSFGEVTVAIKPIAHSAWKFWLALRILSQGTARALIKYSINSSGRFWSWAARCMHNNQALTSCELIFRWLWALGMLSEPYFWL